MEHQENNYQESNHAQNSFDVSYELTYADIVGALTIYGREVHGTKGRIVQLVICAVLVVGFTISFIKDPTYVMALVLAIISLLLGILIWFMPRIQISTQAKAIAQQNATYRITLKGDGIVVGEGDGLYNIPFTDPVVAYENNDYILFVYKKSKIFCIPKRFIEENLLNIRILLKEGLGERYHDLMMRESVKTKQPADREQK